MNNDSFTLVPSIRSKYWKELAIGARVRVAGAIVGYTLEMSPKGQFARFTGKFVCTVEGSDKPLSSVQLMLPKFGESILKASMDDCIAKEGTSIEFALEMSKASDKDSITGYVWECKSLMDPIVPTERFIALLDFKITPKLVSSKSKDGKHEKA
jgi:hypothetical protein